MEFLIIFNPQIMCKLKNKRQTLISLSIKSSYYVTF